MENLKNKLNNEQAAAVNYKTGPLLIVAGAGTGKTKVITERIAKIVTEGWAKSDEILALTFTDKAAGEMVERVDRLLPLGYFDLEINTFHSFCDGILKESGLDIGLPTDYRLLNEFEQYSLFKKNLERFDLDYYRPMGNPTKFIRGLLDHFSRAKDEDITPLEYLKYAEELKQSLDGMMIGGVGKKKTKKTAVIASEAKQSGGSDARGEITSLGARNDKDIFLNAKGEFDSEVAEQEVKKIEELANAYHVYQNLLLEKGALDFGDLINYCLKLFRERPNVLERYRAKYKYVLVDEFQDTNWAQYELVKLLAAPQNNITVVGDDDQSIYRFRGAAMANILEFKKDYPSCQQVFLVENYRSCQEILDLSYDFIKLNNPNRLEEQLKDEGAGLSKKLRSNLDERGVIEVIRGSDTSDELARVVKKIADIKAGDKESVWGDFAILARANDHAKEVCSFLDEAGFPYKLSSSRGLYSKEPILNSINYLVAIADHYDSIALFKTLSISVFGFSVDDLASFNYISGRKGISLYKVLNDAAALGFNKSQLEKVNKFLAVFKKHALDARTKPVSEIFLSFLEDSGYLKFLYSQSERQSVEAANLLNQLMRRIKEFEKDSDDESVRAFLAELTVEIEAGEQGTLPVSEEDDPDTIKIMTVHGSKGLEFKYVFIINLIDQRFPLRERGEAIKLPSALLDEKLPEGDHHLEEERRLFYVAATRAKKGLYLSWSSDAGGKRERRASRFLVEAGLVEDLTEDNAGERQPASLEDKNLLIKKKEKKIVATEPFIPKAPERFSYSQFAAYEKCPYQYRFANILKVPVRGKPSFSFGKTLHATLQKILEKVSAASGLGQNSLFGSGEKKLEPITLEECLKIYAECWDDDWYPSEKLKKEYYDNGRRIVKEFYEENKGNWPKVVFLEKSFSLRLKVDGDGVTIAGKIDRIDESPDGKLRIVDYKTGNPKEKLEFDDKAQLLIYQQAAKELFKQEVGALAFRYLEDGSEIEFLGKDKDFEKLDEKMCNIIRSIRRGEFPPKTGMCKYCDFNGICEYRKL